MNDAPSPPGWQPVLDKKQLKGLLDKAHSVKLHLDRAYTNEPMLRWFRAHKRDVLELIDRTQEVDMTIEWGWRRDLDVLYISPNRAAEL